ncbi:iron reductase domain protein [Hypoxylon argillaceum]|nr:iron reductase domain protein [Hypoxylon argillaceum]
MRTTVRQLVLASLAAFPLTTTAVSSSIFVSPPKNLAFGLNIPNDTSSDLFFSIAFPAHTSWVAIGLGANTMGGNPLVLMAYPSASGRNVTISPRRCYGHSEPVYDPEIDVKTLSGTGLLNDTTFVFNGVCSNCRSWSRNGNLDVSSTSQEMAYATGPSGDTMSDNPRESVKIHESYGSFSMDLARATGTGGVPEIPASENVTSVGAVQQLSKTGYVDKRAILHAVFMIFAFVGIWPFGILVLRVGGSVRWHGINQAVAFGLVLIGAILGFVISTSYNRSKKFNTAHQIIGIIVFIFVIAQLALGYFHHRIYKKTQQPTKFAPIHVWLGRVVIILGIANGFTGFPLALSPNYDFALLGVVSFVLPVFLLALLLSKVFRKLMQKVKEPEGEANGYDMEPWRSAQPEVQPGVQPGMQPGLQLQPPAAYYTGGDPITPTGSGVPPQNARQFV